MTQKESENFLWNNEPERAKLTYKKEMQRQFAEQEKEKFKNKLRRIAKINTKKIKEINYEKWLHNLALIFNFKSWKDIDEKIEKTKDYEKETKIYKELCERADNTYNNTKNLSINDLRIVYEEELGYQLKLNGIKGEKEKCKE